MEGAGGCSPTWRRGLFLPPTRSGVLIQVLRQTCPESEESSDWSSSLTLQPQFPHLRYGPVIAKLHLQFHGTPLCSPVCQNTSHRHALPWLGGSFRSTLLSPKPRGNSYTFFTVHRKRLCVAARDSQEGHQLKRGTGKRPFLRKWHLGRFCDWIRAVPRWGKGHPCTGNSVYKQSCTPPPVSRGQLGLSPPASQAAFSHLDDGSRLNLSFQG